MTDDNGGGRTTLKDVARAAGVSVAAASYALHNRGSVGEGVRQRVRAAAEALGYRPNPMAQAMRTGKTGAIGLIVPDLSNPFFPALAQNVAHAARTVGFRVLIADSQGSHEAEVAAARDLAAFGADGLIWFPVNDVDSLGGARLNLPTVVIDRDVPGYDTVQPDYEAGGALSADWVLGLGHRSVGVVAGPTEVSNSRRRADAAAERLRGQSALAWRVSSPYSLDLEPSVLAALQKEGVTAVLCGADIIALGVMRALKAMGRDTPAEISVLGFDDIHWCDLVTPRLSSVNLPIEEMGAEAVAMLARRIASPAEPRRRIVFETRLVVRDSVRDLR